MMEEIFKKVERKAKIKKCIILGIAIPLYVLGLIGVLL